MPSRAGSQPKAGSRSYKASNHISTSGPSSSQYLNMLNPMGRSHHGYIQANQTPLPEEEEEGEDDNRARSDEDVEAGRGRDIVFQGSVFPAKPHAKSKSRGKVSWDGEASEMHVLRPNIREEDKMHAQESSDDEVPQSFMIEKAHKPGSSAKGKEREVGRLGAGAGGARRPLQTVPGRKVPSATTVQELPLPVSTPPRPFEVDELPRGSETMASSPSQNNRQAKPLRGLDDYEKALWNWVNVYNLDAFLQEVYFYYEGKGIFSIALSRGLNLLTVGFVIAFSTFLLGCVDYTTLFSHGATKHLSDVVIDRCVSRFYGFTLLFFLLFTAFYLWQIITFVLGIIRLVDMYNFYTHLLKIPDADIQTISWPEIVRRIGSIREENPLTAISSKHVHKSNDTATAKLDAHDVANRILRQENYLIALFNKDLLDLRVPLPQFLKHFVSEEGKGKVLTQALEWNLRFCLMEYLFDKHGRVRKVFLKSKNRHALTEGLKRRFIFIGILNAIFAPFIVLYLIMYSFFRYFEEYHKDPSSIGSRRYTSFARWKFREFNELPHLFVRRLDESYPLASMYIGQFPNEKIAIIMRFVAFIAGSFAAVLVLVTVVDPDIIFHFEITPHRSVVFYLGVFGAVLTVARGMIPEENRVFDPELLLTEVINYTHYMPDEWKGQLHSKKVHQEFGELFAMKVLIFAQELLSVVLTPFVLWFSLPNCAPAIIDFFREFTVHVEGRGYVCSFAEFNFERHGNVKFGAPTQTRDKKMLSNEGKMEKSFLNFKAANPDWNPSDPSGSLYLRRIADLNAAHRMHAFSSTRRRQAAAGLTTTTTTGFDAGTRNYVGEQPSPSKPVPSLSDRAQEYDRALLQSQIVATTRRRGVGGMTGSVMLGAGSTVGNGNVTLAGGPSASSIFGAFSAAQMAQTTVLGDSQGSVHVDGVHDATTAVRTSGSGSEVLGEGESDSLVAGSGLDGPYIDGAKRLRREEEDEEEDGVQDAGVLGLLTQIYGLKDGGGGVL